MNFLRQKYIQIFLGALFLINGMNWLLARHLNAIVHHDLVILHYNVDLGVDLIGEASRIFHFPLLGLGVILFNLIWIKIFNTRFTNYLLLLTGLVVNLSLLITLITIYLINFR